MVGIKIGTKLGEKGQIVIPKPIREQFNLQPETELIFDFDDENIIIRKKRSSLDVFEDFITAVKNKKKFPKNIDLDKEYYSQFE